MCHHERKVIHVAIKKVCGIRLRKSVNPRLFHNLARSRGAQGSMIIASIIDSGGSVEGNGTRFPESGFDMLHMMSDNRFDDPLRRLCGSSRILNLWCAHGFPTFSRISANKHSVRAILN